MNFDGDKSVVTGNTRWKWLGSKKLSLPPSFLHRLRIDSRSIPVISYCSLFLIVCLSLILSLKLLFIISHCLFELDSKSQIYCLVDSRLLFLFVYSIFQIWFTMFRLKCVQTNYIVKGVPTFVYSSLPPLSTPPSPGVYASIAHKLISIGPPPRFGTGSPQTKIRPWPFICTGRLFKSCGLMALAIIINYVQLISWVLQVYIASRAANRDTGLWPATVYVNERWAGELSRVRRPLSCSTGAR